MKLKSDYLTHLKNLVLSFVRRMERRIMSHPDGTPGKFTEFSDVKWRKTIASNSLKLTIRTHQKKIDIWHGEATLWRFPEEPKIKVEVPENSGGNRAKKKRAGASLVNYKDAVDSSSGSEEEQVIRPKRRSARQPLSKNARVGRSQKHVASKRAAKPEDLFFGQSRGSNGRRQTGSSRGANCSPQETEHLSQSLQIARQENGRLKELNLQLQRELQQSNDLRQREVSLLQSDIGRLQLELKQCHDTILQLQGGNVHSFLGDWA